MSIRRLAICITIVGLVVPAALFSASVSYLQLSVPSGYSIYNVKADASGDVYALAVSPDEGTSVLIKAGPGSTQSLWTYTFSSVGVLALGSDGSALVAGTTSQPLGVTPGALQTTPLAPAGVPSAYLIKLSASGEVVFATYLCGSAPCRPSDMAIDAQGNILVTGELTSAQQGSYVGFLTPTPGSSGIVDPDVFTVKVDPTGTKLLFAVGAGGDTIALDQAGDSYTAYLDPIALPDVLPSQPTGSAPLQRVFSINSGGSDVGSLYLPAASPSGIDVDSMGNIYLAGSVYNQGYPVAGSALQSGLPLLPSNPQNLPSSSCFGRFPVCSGGVPPLPSPPEPPNSGPGAPSGYISIIGLGGSLTYSTYFGGTVGSPISSLALDEKNGLIDLTGYATSSDLPGVDSGSRNCFPAIYLSQLKMDGSAVVQTVPVLGLSGLYRLKSAVGEDGNIYITDGASVAVVNPQAPGSPVACISNSADRIWTSTVAPGQLLTFFGDNLANGTVAGSPINGRWLPSLAGSDVSVTFDGIPAPLLYASPNQVNVQAPFEISGKTQTTVQLSRAGTAIDTRTLRVVLSAPTIFQVPISSGDCPEIYAGAMEVLAFNQDGSRNTCTNRAEPGSTVTFYVDGLGMRGVSNLTGAVNPAAVVDQSAAISYPEPTGYQYTLPVLTAFGPVTTLPNSISGVYAVQVTVPVGYVYDILAPLLFGGAPAVDALDIPVCGYSVTPPPCAPVAH